MRVYVRWVDSVLETLVENRGGLAQLIAWNIGRPHQTQCIRGSYHVVETLPMSLFISHDQLALGKITQRRLKNPSIVVTSLNTNQM